MSFACSGDAFTASLKDSTGATEDWRFTAVSPPSSQGETWGLVDAAGAADTTRRYGNFTVTRVATGVYDVASAACTSLEIALFATLYAPSAEGYISASNFKPLLPIGATRRCRIWTFDLQGKAADRAFAFWVPKASKAAWANITYDTNTNAAKILASNSFGNTATWNVTAKITSSTNTFNFYELLLPGWSQAQSIAILTSRKIAASTSGFYELTPPKGHPYLSLGCRDPLEDPRARLGAPRPIAPIFLPGHANPRFPATRAPAPSNRSEETIEDRLEG